MSVSKLSSLQNSYKYMTLAIDGYENKVMSGRLYHSSIEGAFCFQSLFEVVNQIEQIFSVIRYPMATMTQRQFQISKKENRKKVHCLSKEPVGKKSDVYESLATFQLCIQYRHHMSWQGYMIVGGSNQVLHFYSFLDLIRKMDGHLSKGQQRCEGLGYHCCRILLNEFGVNKIEGSVLHNTLKEPCIFKSVIQMMNDLDGLLEEAKKPTIKDTERVVVQNMWMAYGDSGKQATFVVKILFRRNHTWQGILYWKEKREQVIFRSFLEMLHLMEGNSCFFKESKKEEVVIRNMEGDVM